MEEEGPFDRLGVKETMDVYVSSCVHSVQESMSIWLLVDTVCVGKRENCIVGKERVCKCSQ